MKRSFPLAALLFIGASLWAQNAGPSKLDTLLYPFERSFTQAAAGEWKSSLDLLERFAMLWHMQNPERTETTRKLETSLNASARALLAAQTAPQGVPRAMTDLSKAVGAYLAAGYRDGEVASPQFFSSLSSIAAGSLDSAQDANPALAAMKVQLYDALWGLAEDAVHAKDPASYARIEAGIDNALSALKAQPADLAAAQAALRDLLSTSRGGTNGSAAATAQAKGIPDLLRLLDETSAALGAGNPREASTDLSEFISAWPLAEGEVKARSETVYAKIEDEMTEAGALLLSGPAARAHAAELLARMRAQLSGLRELNSYSAWDAGMILLREGMEALLVLAALLAMLRKADGRRREIWVWSGAGSGLVLSGVLAIILGFVLAAAAAGRAREQLEGFVGIASVALMVTVGAWLHRRSSLQSWNSFIKKKVGGAIATGSMWSIYALALLAVLREGA
ncbi:MAG TPA: FTR1 family protein, partial [Spirochaetia bacterium]|nr:FTR1 family protein [Spirochaetia bacterium]